MTTATITRNRELLYKASARKPEIVRVPEMGFVMVDGHGDPNTSSEYADAIQALYSLSYTLKFALKKELGLQYRVASTNKRGLDKAGRGGCRFLPG